MHTPSSSTPAPPTSSRPGAARFGGRRAVLAAATAAVVSGTITAIRAGSGETGARAGEVHPAVTSVVADTQRVVLQVNGMYCTSCESTIATMLKRTAGVVRASVSVQRADAVIVYDPARTSPARLIDVIRSLGYTASVRRM